MNKRVEVIYSGTVQGVGFRWTVSSIADKLKVKGWVKNLDDGRVTLAAEAEKEVLEELLQEINKSFSHYIRDTDVRWGPAKGEFKDFGIRF